jgi:heparanase 1
LNVVSLFAEFAINAQPFSVSLSIQSDLMGSCSLLQGGVTILLINLSNSTVNVAINLLSPPKDETVALGDKKLKYELIPQILKVSKPPTSRSEYHLSAPYEDLHSQTVLLNGSPLEVTLSGDFPNLDPIVKDNSSPVSVAPLSIVFTTLPDAQVPICF